MVPVSWVVLIETNKTIHHILHQRLGIRVIVRCLIKFAEGFREAKVACTDERKLHMKLHGESLDLLASVLFRNK